VTDDERRPLLRRRSSAISATAPRESPYARAVERHREYDRNLACSGQCVIRSGGVNSGPCETATRPSFPWMTLNSRGPWPCGESGQVSRARVPCALRRSTLRRLASAGDVVLGPLPAELQMAPRAGGLGDPTRKAIFQHRLPRAKKSPRESWCIPTGKPEVRIEVHPLGDAVRADGVRCGDATGTVHVSPVRHCPGCACSALRLPAAPRTAQLGRCGSRDPPPYEPQI